MMIKGEKYQRQEELQNPNWETQVEEVNLENQSPSKEWRTTKDHPTQNVNGEFPKEIISQCSLSKVYNFVAFVSQIETKRIDEAIIKEQWSHARNVKSIRKKQCMRTRSQSFS